MQIIAVLYEPISKIIITQLLFIKIYRFCRLKVGPPTKGVYLSALTDFGGAEDEVTSQKIINFEKLIGKKIVWAYFSNNWGSGIKFPETAVRMIHSVGVIPFIRMMPRTVFTDGVADPLYTLQGFIDGKFDSALIKWAQDAKRVGIPIMVEFGTEVNGGWFPWSGILNGGAKTNGYGDPNFPDGPERFRDAYRHIIDLFQKGRCKEYYVVFSCLSTTSNWRYKGATSTME